MALLRDGHVNIVGVDEVGRGAWAGPVVAGAVAFPPAIYSDPHSLRDADDSKRVAPARRYALNREILAVASAAVGWADANLIDAVGATEATHVAMRGAVAALASKARGGAVEGAGWHARRTAGAAVTGSILLVDGYPLAGLPSPQRAIVRGDRQCLAIACASLVAKVARDSYMGAMAYPFPTYGFDRHVGYGTHDHFRALIRHGLTPLHRRRFQPMQHLDGCGETRQPALPPPPNRHAISRGQLDFLASWGVQ
ncbi:MAG: ribonuclease HII [Chloroflexota bacterium]